MDSWLIPAGGERAPADPFSYDAVFLPSAGRCTPTRSAEHPWLRDEKQLLASLIDKGIPTMGVCLGSQLLAEAAGARAERAPEPEIGWYELELTPEGARRSRPGRFGLAASRRSSGTRTARPCRPARSSWRQAPSRCRPTGSATRLGHPVPRRGLRSDAVSWAVNYAVDEDAVKMGVDPDELQPQILRESASGTGSAATSAAASSAWRKASQGNRREIGGVALGLASMVIVLSTPHHGDSASEMGMLMGTAFRNIGAGLVAAAVTTYLWRRLYWYERAPWTRINHAGGRGTRRDGGAGPRGCAGRARDRRDAQFWPGVR